jgi:hypothetical protein
MAAAYRDLAEQNEQSADVENHDLDGTDGDERAVQLLQRDA